MELYIKGCRIRISYYFIAACTAMAVTCRDSLFLCGAAAAAVHELGHIAAIMLCRSTSLQQVKIGLPGIQLVARGADSQPAVIIAGAFANALFALACLPAAGGGFHQTATHLISANLCLGLCNILPVEPLDGGVLLRLVCEKKFLPHTADRIVFAFSLCTLTPLAAAGLFAAMQSRGNISLLILCLWLLAGIIRRYI